MNGTGLIIFKGLHNPPDSRASLPSVSSILVEEIHKVSFSF